MNKYFWNTAAGLLNAAEAVILGMLTTRLAGVEAAGILTIAFSVGNLFSSVGRWGIWATLEGKVRSYASLSDTLYVVTGCQYAQSTRYTGNNSGFAVKVPTHYFKALLYRGNSKYATDSFMAAGFYLPHDPAIAEGNCLDYLCSIDELEEKTGIDFFPNLKKKLGAEKADALEAEKPNTSFWK